MPLCGILDGVSDNVARLLWSAGLACFLAFAWRQLRVGNIVHEGPLPAWTRSLLSWALAFAGGVCLVAAVVAGIELVA